MESTGKKKSYESSSMLAPGFRFHPTDEELVRYYLRRKVCGKAFQIDAIAEIEIYKAEPWDLPGMSKLKTRDLEWYFFSVLDRKYGNGARTNRATEKGYWKTTGKDRAVYHRKQIVGMKKTLVYHNGRAPKGQRSNWVMHEYRLSDEELGGLGISQDAFVLCRVFQKSGSGPKNGEQYGAPLVEEEWENLEFEVIPKKESSEEVDFGGDGYLDGHHLEQILGSDATSDISPKLIFRPADGSHGCETTGSICVTQMPLICADDKICEAEKFGDANSYGLPTLYDVNANLVKHEYIGESSKSMNSEDVDYLLDEPFLDSSDYLAFGNEGFIETNDLSNPVEANTSGFDMLEEYLTYFDANDGNFEYFSEDLPMTLGNEAPVSELNFTLKEPTEGTNEDTVPNKQIDDSSSPVTASRTDKQDTSKYQPDIKYPFIKKASQALGNIPAPPAYAAEFPSKNASLHFNSVPSSSSSVHVTAGMIQIQNLTVRNNEAFPSLVKHENLNIILSFGFSRGHDGSANLESTISINPGKVVSSISRDWLYFILVWVLVLSLSFKIGTYACAY